MFDSVSRGDVDNLKSLLRAYIVAAEHYQDVNIDSIDMV